MRGEVGLRSQSATDDPYITVVIPTIGRDDCLVSSLRDLNRQTYARWDCLVIMQGTLREALPGLLKEALPGRLSVFYLDEPNASLARNVGLREARGDVVLFLDDDVIIQDADFLHNHARHYANPRVCGVSGQIRPSDGAVRHTRHWASRLHRVGWLYFPSNYARPCTVLNGGSGNLSVRADWARSVGGMDAHYEKGAHREESDFCLRLTHHYGPLEYDPDASLIHLGEKTGGCRQWGVNAGLHPIHHVVGEWYFIVKGVRTGTIKLADVPHHLYSLLRRQIINSQNVRNPLQMLQAVKRSCRAFRLALAKYRSRPRHLDCLSSAQYRKL